MTAVNNNASLISARNSAVQQIQPVRTGNEKPARETDPELVQKANQFVNQIFWGTLLREFREANKNPIFDNSPGSQTFVRQLDQMMIERISQRGKSPLTDALLKQVDRQSSSVGNNNNFESKSAGSMDQISQAMATYQATANQAMATKQAMTTSLITPTRKN
ncbi:MAG: hypothetical protein JXD22_10465 [Sedimentisphaerales bacterium]|nr:hypothetical protein [Sedimentisphaerales bacterium]